MQIGFLPRLDEIPKSGTPQGRKDRIRLRRYDKPPLGAMNYEKWYECVLSNAKKIRLTEEEKKELYNQYLLSFTEK